MKKKNAHSVPQYQVYWEDGEITTQLKSEFVNSVALNADLTNASCFVADFDTKRIIYQSHTLLYIDEVSDTDILWKCNNSYWSLIPKEERTKLVKLKNCYLRFFRRLNLQYNDSFICTVDYPITIRGKQLFINQRFAPWILDSSAKIRIGVFYFSFSTRKTMDCHIIAQSDKRWRFDFSTEMFREYIIEKRLTEREITIERRKRCGMSDEEIANNLNVTKSTVKSHVSNMLKKLGATSSEEAHTIINNNYLI